MANHLIEEINGIRKTIENVSAKKKKKKNVCGIAYLMVV